MQHQILASISWVCQSIETFSDADWKCSISMQRIPERIIERAVKGMLPKGRLGRSLFNHLKVFKGPKHPHQAQRAQDITNIINAKPEQLKTPSS